MQRDFKQIIITQENYDSDWNAPDLLAVEISVLKKYIVDTFHTFYLYPLSCEIWITSIEIMRPFPF